MQSHLDDPKIRGWEGKVDLRVVGGDSSSNAIASIKTYPCHRKRSIGDYITGDTGKNLLFDIEPSRILELIILR